MIEKLSFSENSTPNSRSNVGNPRTQTQFSTNKCLGCGEFRFGVCAQCKQSCYFRGPAPLSRAHQASKPSARQPFLDPVHRLAAAPRALLLNKTASLRPARWEQKQSATACTPSAARTSVHPSDQHNLRINLCPIKRSAPIIFGPRHMTRPVSAKVEHFAAACASRLSLV